MDNNNNNNPPEDRWIARFVSRLTDEEAYDLLEALTHYTSGLLSQSVIRGKTARAEAGATPYRAPLGYLNARRITAGKVHRTIAVDPVRGPLVRQAFRAYATGRYRVAALAKLLAAKGLCMRPSKSPQQRPLSPALLRKLLRNPYYLGMVPYRGKTYPGRHKALVDRATFRRVQRQLALER